MKNTLRFLKKLTPMLALAAMIMAPIWGWGQTTYIFSSKSWAASPADWTSKKDGFAYQLNQGIQITTGATEACGNSPISFENVTSVKVGYCTNASKGAGTINVFSVADANAAAESGTRIGASTSVSTSGGTTVRFLTFNTTAVTGNIQIYVTCTTNSIYIYSVEITYAAGPTITVNPATLNDFTYELGSGPSAEQNFTVEGSNLTANISIAATTNYEISKSSGTGFTTPLTYTPAEVATPQTVYVRLKEGLGVGSYNSEVITASSAGATDKTVTCSGSVTIPGAGGGLEDFTNSNATSSYTDGSFVGNNGITWTYVDSRDGNGDANSSGITLPALMFAGKTTAKVTSSVIPGGIVDFSVKLYKGFTGGGNRQVELFINGVSKGTSTVFDDYDEHIFTVENIDVSGDIIIKIANTTSKQVIVDDISWTGFSGGPTSPSLTTEAVSSILTTTATGNGTITATGGVDPTTRGFCWDLASNEDPDISDSKVEESGTFSTGAFTGNITGLSAGTEYKVRAFATNSAKGTGYGDVVTFTTHADEPSAHPTGFGATANSSSEITVNWTDATPAADGYLIKGSADSYGAIVAPDDGTAETNSLLVQNVASGGQTFQFTGLNASTTYYFKIYPYNGSAAAINYKTDGTIQQADAKTLDPDAVKWDGGASTTAWTDANNWTNDAVPTATDVVLLDNSSVAGSYEVILPSGNVQTTIKRLTISPSDPSTITLRLPVGNTYGVSNEAGFVVGDNTASTDDIIINSGGILVNASGATSGNGIQVNSLANGTFRINDGGKYLHNTSRSTGGTAKASILSSVAGTEYGIYEFDVPGTSSFSIPASGRTFGSLVLTRTAGSANYNSSGGSQLTIKGDFLLNTGVTYSTTMTGELVVESDLTISASSSFVMGVNSKSSINGILTNNAGTSGILLKSDATGTGSLIHNTASVPATIERYVTAATWATASDGWHLLSSPVASQSISGDWTPTGTGGDYDLYVFDETKLYEYWLNQKVGENNITTFEKGKGYLAAYEQSATKAFAGNVNVADVPLSGLTNTGTSAFPGWHLVGNPFASAINWGSSTWTKTNINAVAQVWSSTDGSYKTTTEKSDIIPSMNGFMVHTTGSGSITIPANARVHNSANWYKSDEDFILLKANDLETTMSQSSIVRFNPAATEAYDSDFDSYFLSGFAPMFYSVSGSDMYALNTLPEISNSMVIPFGFVKNNSVNYNIELAKNIPGTQVYLTDKKTDIVTNLTESPVYSFTSSEGDDPNRFELKFGAVGIDDNIALEKTSIYSHGQSVYISSAKSANAMINIYNITGQQVYANTMVIDGQKQIALNTPTGWYIVKVCTQEGVATQKVFIKSN